MCHFIITIMLDVKVKPKLCVYFFTISGFMPKASVIGAFMHLGNTTKALPLVIIHAKTVRIVATISIVQNLAFLRVPAHPQSS